jgi:hypothetical protein
LRQIFIELSKIVFKNFCIIVCHSVPPALINPNAAKKR